jgi:hypothetical protein
MIHRTHVFRVKHHLLLTEAVECLFKVVKQTPRLFRLHYHVIIVCLDVSSDLSFLDDLNALLICSSPVLEVEHYLCVA